MKLFIIILGILALGIYILYGAIQKDERLKAQCLADGHKEYECASMLRQNSTPVYIYP